MRRTVPAADVPGLVERWVADGLITDEQARRMRADLAPAAPARTPLMVETLGYLGAALVAVAAVLAGSWYWAYLSTAARLGVTGAAAVALGTAGALVPPRTPAGRRLRAVLWLAATAGTGAFLGALGVEAGWADRQVLAIAAGGSAVTAVVCWWRHRHPVQQAGAFAAVQLLAGSLAALPPDAGLLPAVAVWTGGLVWGLLAWLELIDGPRLGRVLGTIAMVGAAAVLAGDTWGSLLALITVAGLAGAAVALRDLAVLTVTSAGALIILPPIADRFFPGTVGVALALLTAGLSLVGAAILAARRGAPRRADGHRGPRPGARPAGPASESSGAWRRGEE